jgi:4a-hydroxytetrahydrobiopterin dehydratase
MENIYNFMQVYPQNWIVKEDKLVREYVFSDFQSAFGFVTKVAVLAEKMGHHPEIFFTWGKVIISLITHDNGNRITDLDIGLAGEINKFD